LFFKASHINHCSHVSSKGYRHNAAIAPDVLPFLTAAFENG